MSLQRVGAERYALGDSMLFAERANEFIYAAWLIRFGGGAAGKPSVKSAFMVA
jgi:hypothetical protein